MPAQATRPFHSRHAVASLLLACAAAPALAAEAPSWFPSEWGAQDQRGAANRITPERTLAALRLARTGRIHSLAQPFRSDMPIWGGRSFQLTIPHADEPPSQNALTANLDFVSGELGQVGTQLDGLGHVGIGDLYYNGNDRREFVRRNGLQRLGIEHAGPFVTRGVMIDVAAYKGVQRLPPGYEVTAADLQGALARQKLTLREGDTLLMRTGWAQLWKGDPAAYTGKAPGWGAQACEWIVRQKPAATGCDTYGCDVVPNPHDAAVLWPCHQIMGTQAGIYNIENLDLETLAADGAHEFLFVMTPLPLVGASGSPVAPIAIR
ncbi:cyclase family protein [Azohydromonas aeria]|uniref:cyclase family protein n=1 Tax=Azohydromonas aeria TaxID=2590212 RepID=UPI0012F8A651|nr:cyclase family protein [Azohydromonas aeria]